MRAFISGTGSFIPAGIRSNQDFATTEFYNEQKERIKVHTAEIIEKFQQITGIAARRYATDDLNASDMATQAAIAAIRDAAVDPETIDQMIVAHNFGDTHQHACQSEAVPSLASRVKGALRIRNPDCVAYDLLFGCPGWLQGLIQADAYIRVGLARKCLVIGTETLSRVIDPYDRDSMIYSDGAGAVVLEAQTAPAATNGILGAVSQSHTYGESQYISMGPSYRPSASNRQYLKMQGRKVYEFALRTVPAAMKACLDKNGIEINEIRKIFLHQANEKMDVAIIKAFYQLYGKQQIPDDILPMNIRELGNSSVATIPTLFDMVRKGRLPGHTLCPGDIVLFASVGAGMNINAVIYKLPN
ncbi:ketoacyl-ACP synthase III [Flavitalea sp. BT771]|uniref:3-oxoacyl-ACP synthase III family protein n=1 Tax=Flavitalea sp. BT771 TaxID=3063329 RepID=UPI0026E34767|nr:ketoacyl-ACP synthase III [Flavitalea sp. BT771]MDO6429750.1 ketoacyl-ACP synthase III [Flavitalea sp. BT771]MDV6218122.1 ketoacyl-ACP synthase III [Flavitalea sp. BT771]